MGFILKTKLTIAIMAFLLSLIVSCRPRGDAYVETPISGPVTVTTEGQVIDFKIRCYPKEDQQFVCLDFARPMKNTVGNWHPQLENGSDVVFKIEIYDSTGASFPFNRITHLTTGLTCLSADDGATNRTGFWEDRYFTRIAIKSNVPVELSRVYWYSYNIGDMK